MNRLWNDLRYGFRMLTKTPGASITVLIALSLGIGLSALTFTLVNGGLLASLPFEDGDRIVRISREDYPMWSSRQRSFENIGAGEMSAVTLAIEGYASEPLAGAAITPSVLQLLPATPALGRAFTEEDAAAGAPAVILVSHDVWRDRMGSDPGALGRTVRVNGLPAQIVGVMPEGFAFPWNQQVWSPLHVDPLRDAASQESRFVVGRLREGVSVKAATQELRAIAREIDKNKGDAADVESTVGVAKYTDLFGGSGSAVLAVLMLGVAFMVLLVACSNVANVLLARAVDRSREVAIRQAIGASRFHITAQLLAEISLLAAAGAAGGVVIAFIGTRFIKAIVPPGMPFWIDFRVETSVIGFVVIVAILAALMAGLMPALQASRSNTHELLKDDSRGSSSFRLGRIMRRLVGVEMAVSFVLLVLAGLFIKSALNFRSTDFAFEPQGVYTARIRIPEIKFVDAAAQARYTEELRQTLSGLPQVAAAALATDVPGVGSSPVIPIGLEGTADETEGFRTRSIIVTPGFFTLFRASLIAGRDFDARDRGGALPVAIVNEAFARKHYPNGALDRRIRYTTGEGKPDWLTIVGVTPDLMAGGVEADIREAIYLPVAQNPETELMIIARSRRDFSSLTAPIRESMAALDSDVALYSVQPLQRVIELANSQYTWFSLIFVISGGVALFLAALGLYGVMAFWVTRRTREIGVRMALGGQRHDIIRLVLSQAMSQTSIGLLAGVVMAVPAGWLLRSALFGVAPHDPIVFGSILTVLIAAALLGCWLPAHRATRMDPLKALVAE